MTGTSGNCPLTTRFPRGALIRVDAGGMAIHDQGRTVGAVEPASADGRFTAQLSDGLPGPLAALLIFIAVAADRGRLPLILYHPKGAAGSPHMP